MSKKENIVAAIEEFYRDYSVVSEELIDSILYSVQAGGKRIRPIILLTLLESFGLELTAGHYQVAAALEMIHTGSLIHDDLPAMDDDDYRRGNLTNHKKFGEATAILAGDSLFLDPYALLAKAELPNHIKIDLIAELSLASGTFGMVGGQLLDMNGESQELNLSDLQAIHRNKTGKLLAFPFIAAGLISQQTDDVLANLRRAGELVGLAFQVRDDILDVTASFNEIGKTPNKDVTADKTTYPSILGLDRSYDILDETLNQAQAIFHKLEESVAFDSSELLTILERLRLHA